MKCISVSEASVPCLLDSDGEGRREMQKDQWQTELETGLVLESRVWGWAFFFIITRLSEKEKQHTKIVILIIINYNNNNKRSVKSIMSLWFM